MVHRHVLIFPIIAGLVWVPAMIWRRKWQSFAIVTAALLALLAIARIVHGLHDVLPLTSRIFVYELLWPYIALTGGIGYYIACLPRPPRPHECRKCRYDLSAHDPGDLICPECGEEFTGRGSSKDEDKIELTPIPTGPPKRRRAI